jgi:hypothetical protein
MQPQQMARLKHFILTNPISLKEVTECIQLALERAQELSLPYLESGELMPDQLAGELNTLRELVETVFQHGEYMLCLHGESVYAPKPEQVTFH